jgi:putative ABC transport system ATP-binding protein
LLIIDDVSMIFWRPEGPFRALSEVSLSIHPQEFVVVTGPVGAGKSLLLSLAAGLIQPSAGTVWVDGVDIYGQSRRYRDQLRLTRIGYVPQFPMMIKRLSVMKNLLLHVPWRLRVVVQERAQALLEDVGLAAKSTWQVGELSAGEAQLVSLVRALALKPEVLLADAPTSLLDQQTSAKVVEALRDYHLRGGSLLIASNDPRIGEAATRVYRLQSGSLFSAS